MKISNRIDYIDNYRGLGIILVILGHALSGRNLIYKQIYSFHMPAFYFISGYLFPINDFLTKYLGTLTGANTAAENFNTTPLWFLFTLWFMCIFQRH